MALLLHFLQELKSVAALGRPPVRPIHHSRRSHRPDILQPSGHLFAFGRREV
jgi:hypothetical protein